MLLIMCATVINVISSVIYFLWTLGVVDWNTDDADIKFSIYCPRTWFSERSFKFSSLTESTLWDRSEKFEMKHYKMYFHIHINNQDCIEQG